MNNDKNKTGKSLKELRKDQKDSFQREVKYKINETLQNPVEKQTRYLNSKKLHYIDYILIILISVILIGLSFIIGIFGLNDIKKTEWVLTLFTIIGFLTTIIVGWYRNRTIANYYNDSRRRYQTTLSEEEGFLRRIGKIILLISLILLTTSIIAFIFFLIIKAIFLFFQKK